MIRHANISVFVPHQGCPNQCSFCNQHFITCAQNSATAADVVSAVNTAMQGNNYSPENTELAFFGGSFTAIDRKYMISLLEAAKPFVNNGDIRGIRISTRPDAISDDVLNLLKNYGVTAIELGAQSMVDSVLQKNFRGHTAQQVVDACCLIREHGFELGLQMMTGLFGDSDEGALYTAQKIIDLRPDTVRIYPTIVLKNTHLARLYEDKKYTPQTLEGAVDLAARLIMKFRDNAVKIIRVGLHTIDNTQYLAGPFHPAFKQLCDSEIYRKNAENQLLCRHTGDYMLLVNPGAVSNMVGQKKKNLLYFKQKGYNCKVVPKSTVKEYKIIVKRCGEE